MTDLEKIKQLVAEFKSCSVANTGKCFSPISDVFPLLCRDEQNQNAAELYEWGKENAVRQPFKFPYTKFLYALNTFFNERYDVALTDVSESQKLFEERNDINGVAICLALSGGLYRTLGNVDLALKTLWESYDLLKGSDINTHFLSANCCNIGSIYLEMGNFEEAIQLFNKSYDLSEKVNDSFWANYSLHNLGKAYLMQNKYPEAKKFLDLAMRNAEKSMKPLAISNSLTELANYHYQTANFAEAERLHRRALDIREQNKFIGAVITSCIRLGEVYIKQFKPEEALLVLNKGLHLAEEIKVKPKQYQIHQLLSEIYQRRNELDKSLFHYKQYHEIREQVEIEDSAKKLKNAQLIFEAEQTKKENIIIKKQKREIEKKNSELQETIDELTRTRIGKKARAFTLMLAILFFIFEDSIMHFALHAISTDNYYISMGVKFAIIFSLKPINGAIEHYLLKKVVRKRREEIYNDDYVNTATGTIA